MEQIDLVALVIAVPIAVLTVGFVLALSEQSTPDPDRLERSDINSTLKLDSPLRWGATIGLFLLFLASGLHITTGTPSVPAVEAVLSQFELWGYSEEFALFIGGSQLFAAILLIPPQTSSWASGYLGVVMVGSIYTHLTQGALGLALVPLVVLAWTGYVGKIRLPWALGRRVGSREPVRQQ